MDDLISRQAVLNLLATIPPEEAMTKAMLIQSVKQMDAAQPEIIHCKDCNHKFIENGVWNCPFGLSGGELFFCGYGNRQEDDI